MKISKTFLCLGLILILFLLLIIVVLFNANKNMAYADISKPYKIEFDYNYEDGQNLITEESVFKTNELLFDEYNSGEIEFQIYGDKYLSNITYLGKVDYISTKSITIYTNSKFDLHDFEVFDDKDNKVLSSSANSCNLDNLLSNIYYVNYVGITEIVKSETEKRIIKFSAEFELKIDVDSPKFFGTSTSIKGLCTNDNFTVSVIDDDSGVKNFYWRSPTDSAYSLNLSNEKIFTNNKNGIYRFYAIDNVGNRTATNYVYFDNVAPELTVLCEDNKYSDSCTIYSDFSVEVKESGSGLKELKFKSPTVSDWEEYSAGSTIHIEGLGEYEFKATDNAGNKTNITVNVIENTDIHSHNFITTIVKPTCTERGYSLFTCTICDENYIDNYTDPVGHNFNRSFHGATCTEYGETIYTCQICGYEYSENNGAYPTGHNYINLIEKEPTCTQYGQRKVKCETCGDEYTMIISANGHNYEIIETVSNKGITTRNYTCTVCGYSYKQELGDQFEEVTNYIEYLFEQYVPYMWWVLLAAAGIWSIVIGVMIAIAQKNEDKEKARKMLINYVIGLVVIAIIVVACPFLIRGIAALVT